MSKQPFQGEADFVGAGNMAGVRISSLEDLVLRLGDPRFHGFYFRGHEDATWQLLSSLDRLVVKTVGPGADFLSIESSLIGFFKRQAHAVLRPVPDDHDLLGWLSLMQHYGAPTRFLDWTTSPFVALYFAVKDLDESLPGALWALHPTNSAWVNSGVKTYNVWNHSGFDPDPPSGTSPRRLLLNPSAKSFVEAQAQAVARSVNAKSKWPLPLVPNYRDERMAAQQAVFTVTGAFNSPIEYLLDVATWGRDVERINELPRARPNEDDQITAPYQILQKFEIPGSWKRMALDMLRAMGITPASLFPGVDGIGEMTAQSIYLTAVPENQIAGIFQDPTTQEETQQ